MGMLGYPRSSGTTVAPERCRTRDPRAKESRRAGEDRGRRSRRRSRRRLARHEEVAVVRRTERPRSCCARRPPRGPRDLRRRQRRVRPFRARGAPGDLDGPTNARSGTSTSIRSIISGAARGRRPPRRRRRAAARHEGDRSRGMAAGSGSVRHGTCSPSASSTRRSGNRAAHARTSGRPARTSRVRPPVRPAPRVTELRRIDVCGEADGCRTPPGRRRPSCPAPSVRTRWYAYAPTSSTMPTATNESTR